MFNCNRNNGCNCNNGWNNCGCNNNWNNNCGCNNNWNRFPCANPFVTCCRNFNTFTTIDTNGTTGL